MMKLENLVTELVQIKNTELQGNETNPIENILQLVGKELITKCQIIIGNIVIEPLWLEAYYYNACMGFMDPFAHRDPKQMNHYGQLYFHHKTDDQRSGVDICLSLSNEYYLSYLLKYTLVNGEFTTQAALSKKIRSAYEQYGCEVVIKTFTSTEQDIVGYTERIGLVVKNTDENKNEKELYKSLNLAIVKNFNVKYNGRKKLPQIEKLADSYLASYEGNKEEECKRILGYCRSQYRGK